ncbi:hypothetical protein KKG45_05500 [bacterium]|nr:hypothetical protein [bacterium]MBU1072685.1 hypothetical protein [bacterium]MBU1677151.1 hypothetical protein [bacterium]
MPPELDTFDCRVDLPGWRLHLASLTVARDRDLGNVMDVATRGALSELKRSFPDGRLEAHATISALRDRLPELGCNPDTTPPCSELLLSAITAAGGIHRGCLAWEFLSMLTIRSAAPWTVLDRRSLRTPLVFRPGETGETLPQADGRFDCAGLPVLADQAGVKASPWTLGAPEALQDLNEVVFLCFLPADLFRSVNPRNHLGRVVWLTWAYRFVFERTCRFREQAG